MSKPEDVDSATSATTLTEVTSTEESVRRIDDLKFFLATAPANWQENQIIRRYFLNREEGFVSCVFWNNLYFITGTDIVRCVAFKFKHFGREVVDRKKFEEGIFSDLRNLKCGKDAILEEPRSDFLRFLQKNQCLRTQKKQKVFFWFSVPHDKLFTDALERDLHKESKNQLASTRAVREPALSFMYNSASDSVPLFDQLSSHLDQQKFRPQDLEEDDNVDDARQVPVYVASPRVKLEQVEEHMSSPLQLDSQVKHHRITFSGDPDDDFPLDYFLPESNEALYPPEELHPFGLYGDPYISYGQPHPTMFMDPYSAGLNRNYGDPYLLEQTTPVVPISMSLTPRSKAKFDDPEPKNVGYAAYDDDFEPLVGIKYPEYYYMPTDYYSPHYVAPPPPPAPMYSPYELGTGFPPTRATLPLNARAYPPPRSARLNRTPQSIHRIQSGKITKPYPKGKQQQRGKSKLSNPNLQHVDLDAVFQQDEGDFKDDE